MIEVIFKTFGHCFYVGSHHFPNMGPRPFAMYWIIMYKNWKLFYRRGVSVAVKYLVALTIIATLFICREYSVREYSVPDPDTRPPPLTLNASIIKYV